MNPKAANHLRRSQEGNGSTRTDLGHEDFIHDEPRGIHGEVVYCVRASGLKQRLKHHGSFTGCQRALDQGVMDTTTTRELHAGVQLHRTDAQPTSVCNHTSDIPLHPKPTA
eukprot:scaffold188_cov429-Prasinococcus_capsulatus_cf.AAC.11